MNSNKLIRLTKKILTIVLAVYSLNMNAQHSTSSPYSRFGIGDISSNGNSQTYGLGNLSAGFRSPFSINSVNPASYSALSQNTFLLDFGINYKSTIFETNDAEQYNNDANISQFSFAFAAKKWLYFSAGLKPVSYVGYDIENVYSSIDETEDVVSYTGQGGINKVYVGTSILLYKRLSIGVNLNYLFGSINRTTSSYVNTESGSSVVESIEDNVYKKFTPEFGIQYSDTIFGGNLFTLGVVFNKKNDINTYTELLTKRFLSINGNSFDDTISYVKTPNAHLTVPSSWGVGFSYNLNSKILIAADYFQQDWTKSNIEDIESFKLIKEYTAAAGLEFVPKLGGNKLSQNIRYRIGGYYKNSYLEANDQTINTSALTFGLGLPFKGSRNTVNFAVELGRRGTTDNNLLQETYGLFSISLSLHDYWFRKFKIN